MYMPLANILDVERTYVMSSKFICVLETDIPHCESTIRAKRFTSRSRALSLHGYNEARHFFAFRNERRTRRQRDQIRRGIMASLVANLAPVTYAFIHVPSFMNIYIYMLFLVDDKFRRPPLSR